MLQPRKVLLSLWSATLVGIAAAIGHAALKPLAPWLVGNIEQPGQRTFYNGQADAGSFGHPVEIGDYDGDGFLDFVLAPIAATTGPNGDRRRGGEVYVYPGDGAIAGVLDRATLGANPRGLTLMGARPGDVLGTELFSADVNGDGLTDLIVGSQNYDAPDGARRNCGAVYVVLGRPGLLPKNDGEGLRFDMAAPPPGVILIVGPNEGDRLGIWVEAGDLDRDGRADILMAADRAARPDSDDPARRTGGVAVLYGRSSFPPVIDLRNVSPETAEAEGVAWLYGEDAGDHFGSCVHARDMDLDGWPELIVSAALNRLSAEFDDVDELGDRFTAEGHGGGDGPGETRFEAGEVFVLFGDPSHNGRLPTVTDYRNPSPETIARTTLVMGQYKNGVIGEEITTGDFNGDGYPDLALGGLAHGTIDGLDAAGAVFLVYWQPELRGKVIDPFNPQEYPPGLRVSRIRGSFAYSLLGDTLSVGDFNNDGFDDLAIGMPWAGPPDNRNFQGIVTIVYGRTEPFAVEWFPELPSGQLLATMSYVFAPDGRDAFSYSMEARDIDGDGYADLFPNAMKGNGALNALPDAGEAYLISGFHLSGGEVRVDGVAPSDVCRQTAVEAVIHGAGFTRDSDTKVFVGGSFIPNATVLSGTQIRCVLPAQTAVGPLKVRVENRHGAGQNDAAASIVPCFIRGDAGGDQRVDLGDAIQTLFFLFDTGSANCRDAMDANDDGAIDISDPILILFYLFEAGTPPSSPFPETGMDTTADKLECESR